MSRRRLLATVSGSTPVEHGQSVQHEYHSRGVMARHDLTTEHALPLQEEKGLSPDSRCLQTLSISFLYAVRRYSGPSFSSHSSLGLACLTQSQTASQHAAVPARTDLSITRRRIPGHPAFQQQIGRPQETAIDTDAYGDDTADETGDTSRNDAVQWRTSEQCNRHSFVDFSKQLPRCATGSQLPHICGLLAIPGNFPTIVLL